MKYARYAFIPTLLRPHVMKEYELPTVKEPDVRIVDDSAYVPNKKANEILMKNKALSVLSDMVYDSPDDIKSGAVNVYARQKGRDMAEITQMQRRLEKQAMEELNQSLADTKKARESQAQAQVQAQAQAQVQAQAQANSGKSE